MTAPSVPLSLLIATERALYEVMFSDDISAANFSKLNQVHSSLHLLVAEITERQQVEIAA